MVDNLVGKVRDSVVSGGVAITTTIYVKPDKGQEVPFLPNTKVPYKFVEIQMRGRHILGGHKISIDYENHTGKLWASAYNILNKKGEIIHTDFALG